MAPPTQPSGGLEGMAVLVTGGGTGIGRACAARLAADGAAVTICGRTVEKLEEAAKQIETQAGHGGSVQWTTADVTNEDDVKAAVATAMEPTGTLDGCIANAGGGGGMGPYHVQDTQEFIRILHLNVLGTMLCVKHTAAHMVENGGGSFVGMSSIAGHLTHLWFGAYTAGKAGIVHLHLGDGERGLDLVRQALRLSELPARVFNPTHVNRRKALFEEAIELAREGSTVDITAFPVAEDEDAWAADVALLKYLESGAPANRVTVSSDGGGCLPVFNDAGEMLHMDIGRPMSLIETLQTLLDGGSALAQVLPAFTSNVADILRLHDRGRIRDGDAADLIVLNDKNEISDVMIAGIWHVQAGAQQVFGQFENQDQ